MNCSVSTDLSIIALGARRWVEMDGWRWISKASMASSSDVAVRSPEMELTFADLYRATSNLTYRLSSFSASPQDILPCRIAILMRKGWEQIVACLAVLKAGCCYVPLEQSDCRWRRVLCKARCSSILIAEDVEVQQELAETFPHLRCFQVHGGSLQPVCPYYLSTYAHNKYIN